MRYVIALTGLPRCGKDTVAAHLVEKFGFVREPFAKPLKEAAAILLNRPLSQMEGADGFDREAVMPEWGFSVRHFLQYFGTEGVRNFSADFWVKHWQARTASIPRVVVTDLRFENEATAVRAVGGLVIHLRRSGISHNGHVSNAGVAIRAPDVAVTNDGTIEELLERTERVVRLRMPDVAQ